MTLWLKNLCFLLLIAFSIGRNGEKNQFALSILSIFSVSNFPYLWNFPLDFLRQGLNQKFLFVKKGLFESHSLYLRLLISSSLRPLDGKHRRAIAPPVNCVHRSLDLNGIYSRGTKITFKVLFLFEFMIFSWCNMRWFCRIWFSFWNATWTPGNFYIIFFMFEPTHTFASWYLVRPSIVDNEHPITRIFLCACFSGKITVNFVTRFR